MKAQVITSRRELDGLSGEWNELLRSSRADSIFLTWEWISTWLDAVRPDAELLVAIARTDDGRLVGIAPFYRTGLRLMRLVDYRCLRVLGDVDAGAEYPDLVVDPGTEQTVLPVLRNAVLQARDRWDCIWLPNVAGWTGAADRWRAFEAVALPHRSERPAEFGAVPLPESHGAYLKLLSGNARSTLRRQSAHVGGSSRLELRRCGTEAELEPMLGALFELHRRRWESIGENGSFVRESRMEAFYRGFAPVALRRGWLRLFALEVEGRIAAVQYGYAYAGVFNQIQEGYDPEAPAGVGNVLRNLVFEACIAEGLRGYDFLGEYTEHKRRWGAERRCGCDLFLGRRGLSTTLLFYRPVWPTGRYLRSVAPPAKASPTLRGGALAWTP